MAYRDLHCREDLRRTARRKNSVWRPLLFSLGVLFAQIGPVAACDIFDGPGKPGCPAAFSSFSSHQTGHDPDGKGGDCSEGPSYLALDTELQPAAPNAKPTDVGVPVDADSSRIAINDWNPRSDSLGVRECQPNHARHIYLSTLRLRI